MSEQQEQILLAKQPIYRKDQSLYGFELLFRNQISQHATEVGEELATSQVLVNYSTSVSGDIDRRGRPLFINVSENFLLSDAFIPIENNHIVVELLERISVTHELVSAVQAWHKNGYRFALDDYDFDPKWAPLLPYAKYIKIDILDADLNEIAQKIKGLDTDKHLLVAERIEDHDTFEQCKAMGFDLFQGYYLARPKELLGNKIRPSSAITAQIIKKSGQPDASINEISELVEKDPKLTLQLLKLINSSLFTLPREIKDLREAITFLGIDLLKQWAMMISFVSDATAHIESCRIILIRAKACELYVEHSNENNDTSSSAFLAGLLSGIDVLLGIEPEVFISEINLSEELKNAVIHGKGRFGKLIDETKTLERFITQSPSNVGKINPDLLTSYSQAQRWAGEIIETLLSPEPGKN